MLVVDDEPPLDPVELPPPLDESSPDAASATIIAPDARSAAAVLMFSFLDTYATYRKSVST